VIPVSFEFFPPKTDEQQAVLEQSLPALRALNPEYFSVTFGAGGSTLDYTLDTVRKLCALGLDVAPHLSCMGGKRSEIRALLQQYQALGVHRLVALRGDMPSGMASMGEFRYARDLVEFVRAEWGPKVHIEVACYPEFHPQAEDAESDLRHFVEKCHAGADRAITQYFYNADAYFRFVDDVRRMGCEVPILPGIMPISNYTQLKRFSAVCGAEIPRWIERRLMSYGDDVDSIREFGADVVAKMVRQLIAGGAPAMHVYTLNRSRPTLALMQRLTS
jgi:methylenetetrahydrofolate reductase (NADPH)